MAPLAWHLALLLLVLEGDSAHSDPSQPSKNFVFALPGQGYGSSRHEFPKYVFSLPWDAGHFVLDAYPMVSQLGLGVALPRSFDPTGFSLAIYGSDGEFITACDDSIVCTFHRLEEGEDAASKFKALAITAVLFNHQILTSAVVLVFGETAAPHTEPAPLPKAAQCEEHLERVVDLYLDSMARSVTGYALNSRDWEGNYFTSMSSVGTSHPINGLTMVGFEDLDFIRYALEEVDANGVPGDFLEAGVWRGGASIYARAVLKAYNSPRHVWVADSFQGLPLPSTNIDESKYFFMTDRFDQSVSESAVRGNFDRAGLLDDQVHLVPGYFNVSLPLLRRQNLTFSVLRMDADMFESTLDVLFHLYDSVAVGGFVIVDDWHIPECRRAVHTFRGLHGITNKLVMSGQHCASWVKAAGDLPARAALYNTFQKTRNFLHDHSLMYTPSDFNASGGLISWALDSH